MRYAWLTLCLISVLFFGLLARAETYNSSNYTSADPVVTLEGSYSSSSNFQLFGSSGPLVIGESTSTSFIYRTGFLYFPLVAAPTVAATAGDAAVSLSWNAATVALGYTVSGYAVGRSTVSGGPFTFSDVGNVLNSNQGGLTNSTLYYFVVRVKDAFGNVIATSTQVSATPTGSGQNNGGGGGGGGGGYVPSTRLVVTGNTFPQALVSLLHNGVIIGTTQSDSGGNFTFNRSVPAGVGQYMLYAENKDGDRSGAVSHTATVLENTTVRLENVIIPPILTTDKQSVVSGDTPTFFGNAIPRSMVVITIDEIPGLQIKTVANDSGEYSTPFVIENLGKSTYIARSRLEYRQTVSGQSLPVTFVVGDKTEEREKKQCRIADFNCDGKVNLVDFSILIYWFIKPSFPKEIDLNSDGKIDLIDFSILMYYWTGD